jgi:nucleoside-diphosphate-sugar epimerase
VGLLERMESVQECGMIEGRRILITGGGGFIGSVLAEALAPSNEVILYDINFHDNAFSYTSLATHPNVRCIPGDILDLPRLSDACSGANIVVHLAAIVGVQQVHMNTLDTLEVNIQGTRTVLQSISPKATERFVYLSSSEVYGTHAYGAKEDDATSVGPATDPRWCYAASKVSSEHLVQGYHRERGLATVILRPFNVFGPKRIGDHTILRFIYQGLNHAPLTVHNDGSSIRSWCYVSDFVEGLLRALESDDAVGMTLNIGNALNTVTTYQLACDIIEVCDSKSGIVFVPFKHSDVHIRVPDISRAREILGYEPQVSLAQGLRVTKNWYQKHASRIAPMFLTR